MRVTLSAVEEAINNGNKILKEVYPLFTCPHFHKIVVRKANSYWGNIRVRNGSYELHISRLIESIPDEKMARKALNDTVVHELIHTIPGCFNHGDKFVSIANKVNKTHAGYNVKIKNCASEYGFIYIKENKYKYLFHCNTCGNEVRYMRTPKYDVSEYTCMKCNTANLSLIKL
uniref:SprT-like protein n=1 Tax=Siphoviridae sp. ctrpg19 TaxID=2826481 RepID=A0A8S5MK60_9CAUD|nr:MAG TPA: SprT-like protein [Siphoviridae sp. ctrpg19]